MLGQSLELEDYFRVRAAIAAAAAARRSANFGTSPREGPTSLPAPPGFFCAPPHPACEMSKMPRSDREI